jgi:signal peptidase II
VPERPQDKAAPRLNRIVLLGLVTFGVATFDQVTKVLAFNLDGYREMLGGIVVFSKALNPGAAFGIFGKLPYSAVLLTFTTIATIIVLGWLFRHFIETHLFTGVIALGLIYGGALGNLIDRIAFGKVRDFIELHLRLFTWPAFNVADICIVAGIILLLTGLATLPVHKHPARQALRTSSGAPARHRSADTNHAQAEAPADEASKTEEG